MKALLDTLAGGTSSLEQSELGLARLIDSSRIPRHIAIIMDGNGRWARQRNLPRVAGHKAGVKSVRSVVETSARMGVGALTLYAFSIENWKRPRTEVDMLWQLLRIYLRSELSLMEKHDIRFNALGRVEALPTHVRRELDEVIRATSSHRGLRLNLAINYGGRAEIVDAVRRLVEDSRTRDVEITEESIAARLYTSDLPDPDLLIRTSGEMRVSNFLLWQIAYSELYVTETRWPDFDRSEFLRAIIDFQKRDRRFGGLSAQPDVTHGVTPDVTEQFQPKEDVSVSAR
ncbi:MAG: isoprenyl transferase [Acidobacteriota bacterium]